MILGKLFKYVTDKLADAAGLPEVMKDDYAAATGGEALGTIIEYINDMATRGWLNKAINGFLALGMGLAAIKAPIDPSTKMELLTTANHLVSRIADAKPSDYAELADSIKVLMEAIRMGNWELALKSGLRPLEEHKAMLRSLGILREVGVKEMPTPGTLSTPSAPSTPLKGRKFK